MVHGKQNLFKPVTNEFYYIQIKKENAQQLLL